MPGPTPSGVDAIRATMQAFDHFSRVMAIRCGERVLMLTDPYLDPRVVQAIEGLARARGASLRVFMEATSQVEEIPPSVRPLLEEADFVVSTWFCSVISPLCIELRRRGQRWVKITYFRDFDLLQTPQACFPPELVGELIRSTANRFPEQGDFDLVLTNPRGTKLRIGYTEAMCHALLSGNRWRGQMLADEPGCYVHYLPSHGPNLWDRTAHNNDDAAALDFKGELVPDGAVGFPDSFDSQLRCSFEGDTIVAVDLQTDAPWGRALAEALPGARLIELGCGFAPKASRSTIYPAGSNAPGTLHFGVTLREPSAWLRTRLPQWEEPPTHLDLVVHDATVRAGGHLLIDNGDLLALHDPAVLEAAARFGDPLVLLEGVP